MFKNFLAMFNLRRLRQIEADIKGLVDNYESAINTIKSLEKQLKDLKEGK